jgi:hypothetical protein
MVSDSNFHTRPSTLTEVRRTLCYPILATITLLVSIRDDPNQPRALTDVTLLGSMVNFLSKMEDLGVSAIYQIRRVCLELERIARETVERAQLGGKRPKLSNQQSVSNLYSPALKWDRN